MTLNLASTEADRAAIVQLTIDYCWALDTASWDDLRNVFTPDVVADLGAGGQRGVDEIIGRVSKALAPPMDESQHMVTNHQVVIDGDRAECRCQLQAQHVRHRADGDLLYTVGGRYEDQLTRTADGWRISQRRLVVVWIDGTKDVFKP
jgi:hypothetical protein